MELRLMELMQGEDYLPLNTQQLGDALKLGKSQIDELQSVVDRCLKSGILVYR